MLYGVGGFPIVQRLTRGLFVAFILHNIHIRVKEYVMNVVTTRNPLQVSPKVLIIRLDQFKTLFYSFLLRRDAFNVFRCFHSYWGLLVSLRKNAKPVKKKPLIKRL